MGSSEAREDGSQGRRERYRAFLERHGLEGEGWTVRFTAGEARAREMAALYREAGFRARALPLSPGGKSPDPGSLERFAGADHDPLRGADSPECAPCLGDTYVVVTKPEEHDGAADPTPQPLYGGEQAATYAVVGGGVAGVTVAAELRAREPDARVVLFDAEPRPLYSRMLLKEYAKGAVGEDAIRVHDETWFERRGIEYRGGTRVTGTTAGEVLTEDGEALAYDALFATAGGSQVDPFGITAEAENATGLWTLEEARRVRRLAEGGELGAAVVIGAGFLGLELADALATWGVETHFVMRGHWSRHGVGRPGSRIVHRALEEHGVTVQDDQRVEGFEVRDGRVTAVRTDRREIPCGLVGVAVGLAPNVEYLGGTGAEVQDGVLVDEHMRSADPRVYAAGDTARYRDVLLGGRRRAGTWLSAIDQARVAAASATGEEARFERVEAHSLAVGGLDAPVVFLGDWDGGDEAVERRYGEARYRRITFREGRPVGASLIGESGDVTGQLKQLIRAGPALDEAGRESLLEPHIDHGRRA